MSTMSNEEAYDNLRRQYESARKLVAAECRRVIGASDSKATNPKDDAATNRLDLSLFPDSAVAYGALAFVEGDQKYGGFNWRVAGVMTSVYIAAARRHLAKYFNGEWADPKTRVPHLANALACIAILIDAHEQGNLNDDRPPPQNAGLYDGFARVVEHLRAIFPRRTARYRAQSSAEGIVTKVLGLNVAISEGGPVSVPKEGFRH